MLFGVKMYIQYEKDEVCAIFDTLKKAKEYAKKRADNDENWTESYYIQKFKLNDPEYKQEEDFNISFETKYLKKMEE